MGTYLAVEGIQNCIPDSKILQALLCKGSGFRCWHCIELKFIKELLMEKLLSIEFPWLKTIRLRTAPRRDITFIKTAKKLQKILLAQSQLKLKIEREFSCLQ